MSRSQLQNKAHHSSTKTTHKPKMFIAIDKICCQSNPECSHHDAAPEEDPNEGQPHRRFSLRYRNVTACIKNATSTYATAVTTTSGFHFILTYYEFLQTQNQKFTRFATINIIQPVYFISKITSSKHLYHKTPPTVYMITLHNSDVPTFSVWW